MSFGICMEGNEAALARAVSRASDAWALNAGPTGARFHPFTYVEIGLAEAQTMAGMLDLIAARAHPWAAVGYDLPDGWSMNHEHIKLNLGGRYAPRNHDLDPGCCQVVLESAQTALPRVEFPIHLALIDGCHGAPCVEADFKLVEAKAPIGAVVVFHDANEGCQGIHLQPHCQTGIDVRQALRNLGLLDNTRPGWRFVEQPDAPHAVAVFERVA